MDSQPPHNNTGGTWDSYIPFFDNAQQANAGAMGYLPQDQYTSMPASFLDYDEGEIEEDEDYWSQDDAIDGQGFMSTYASTVAPPIESGIPGLTSPSPTNTSPKQDARSKAENEEKAALLRAKLLEKRTNSRGPLADDKAGISAPPAAAPAAAPAVEASVPFGANSALENLLREEKEAAEAKAQQNKPYSYGTQPQKAVAKSGKTSPALLVSTKKKTRSQNWKAQEKRSMNVEQQATPGAEAKNKSTAGKVIGNNIRKQESPIPAAKVDTIPSRSNTLLSTSTIQQEPTSNKPTIADNTLRNIAPKVDALVVRGEASPRTLSELSESNDKRLLNARDGGSASYSHHFDDLDEWLEITGYHDRGNRDRVLSLYRRRAELERQMAEVERELEQSTVQRTRSVRAIAESIASPLSMRPPTKPEAIPKTIASSSGTKRSYSPERHEAIEMQHTDKQRRLSTTGNSTTLEVSSGPRATESKDNNTRLADTRSQARGFSPTNRRVSLNDNRSQEDRGRLSIREQSPRRRGSPIYPVPNHWNVYRPGQYEQRAASPGFYRGRGNGRSSRGGSARGTSTIGRGGRVYDNTGAGQYDFQKNTNFLEY